MKKVSIIVLEGCTPIVPVGAMEILNKASVIHQQVTQTNKLFFEPRLVAGLLHST